MSDRPTISATVSDVGSDVDVGATPAPVPCFWHFPSSSDEEAATFNIVTEIATMVTNAAFFRSRTVTVTYFYDDGVLNRWNQGTGRFEWRQQADCTGATAPAGVSTGDIRYVPTAPPDPAILLRRTTVIVTEEIDIPTPSLSPPDGAAINLGLWLGVEPVPPVVARATLGPLWAETTATLATTSFDLGNGDTVTCDGNGTPIPETGADTVAAGPCGYTYTDRDDLAVTTVAVTATWLVTWELSDGRTGADADVVVSTAVPYEVYEIQTVGVGG